MLKLLEKSGYEVVQEVSELQNSAGFVALKAGKLHYIKASRGNDQHFSYERNFVSRGFVSEKLLYPIEVAAEYIVYPYIDQDYLGFANSLSTGSYLKLLAKIADGLAALHDAGFLHGDIKAQNILISSGDPLICDFGTLRDLKCSNVRILNSISNHQPVDREWSAALDIYGLGVLLFQHFYGLDFIADYVFQKFVFPASRISLDGNEEAIQNLIRMSTSVASEKRCSISQFIQAVEEISANL
ncbi:MAG: protein kinase family protein [Proteobacteria bacterium]|nr:MAG: protein kinase family protein [Pseudomonadota bacterium]